MTLKLSMRHAARLAATRIGGKAPLLEQFVQGTYDGNGGFRDAGGQRDLVATAYGIEVFWALEIPLPLGPTETYLRGFGTGEGLGFEALAALARCWSNLPVTFLDRAEREAILGRLEAHRSLDGGYQVEPDARKASPWACLLAVAAYQDLHTEIPDVPSLVEALEELRSPDGGFRAGAQTAPPTTVATAMGLLTLIQLGRRRERATADWLLAQRLPDGGFGAAPGSGAPELAATALALHALAQMKVIMEDARFRQASLDYLDRLWRGGGYAYRADRNDADGRSSFQALLALGHLIDPYAYLVHHEIES